MHKPPPQLITQLTTYERSYVTLTFVLSSLLGTVVFYTVEQGIIIVEKANHSLSEQSQYIIISLYRHWDKVGA